MKFLVRPELPTASGWYVASAARRRGQLCTFSNLPENTYLSGYVVQTNRATSNSTLSTRHSTGQPM